MDVYALRALRVKELIDRDFSGKQAAFADAVDIASSTVSRWFMPGQGKKRIGDRTAVKIEQRLGLPSGAMLAPGDVHAERRKAQVVSMPVRDPESWPFSFSRERFDRLTERQKGQIEGAIKHMLNEFEAAPNRSQSKRRG